MPLGWRRNGISLRVLRLVVVSDCDTGIDIDGGIGIDIVGVSVIEGPAAGRLLRSCGVREMRGPPAETRVPGFPHENLDCYRLAVEIARWTLAQRFPPRCAELADQANRAATSVPLNIAEACRGGAAGKNHFRIAMGSAGELCAALDLVDLPEGPARDAELRRVGAMPRRLAG